MKLFIKKCNQLKKEKKTLIHDVTCPVYCNVMKIVVPIRRLVYIHWTFTSKGLPIRHHKCFDYFFETQSNALIEQSQ